jgi:hypothetical protein
MAMRRRACVNRDFIIARDLRARRDAADALNVTQQVILRFGKLLMWWPDLVAAAQAELQETDGCLGTAL